MKYRCEECDFETVDKSNFNKHMKTDKHKNIVAVSNEKKLQIYGTNNISTEISKSDVVAVKNETTAVIELEKKIWELEKEKQISEITLQLQKEKELVALELRKEKELVEKLTEKENVISKLKDDMINIANTQDAKNNNNGSKNTIDVIDKSYPEAPEVKPIEDIKKLVFLADADYVPPVLDTDTEDEEKMYNGEEVIKVVPEPRPIEQVFINNHRKKNLANMISTELVDSYQKEDPKMQSIWTTDVARQNYALKTKTWQVDSGGTKLIAAVIKPFLRQVRELIGGYIKVWMKRFAKMKVPTNQQDERWKDLMAAEEIMASIANNSLANKISTMMAPHFKFDKNNPFELRDLDEERKKRVKGVGGRDDEDPVDVESEEEVLNDEELDIQRQYRKIEAKMIANAKKKKRAKIGEINIKDITKAK